MGEKVSLELSQEKQLALAYWKRYPDVREHPLWGEQGALGIKGPADHYRHHGRQEGRVFQELITAKDTAREAKLAEAYWSRYPDVAQSPVWGKKSALGVAGPRDHYLLFGQDEGRIWGE
ncbi:MAG: hypothetical protein CSA33_04240 [Desulfobulbus propionicus]|nr:MAG: hypothetical protein CSA33_04240 [Desulfobulbus propionicus]